MNLHTIDIELDVFSGRPNPRWPLQADEARELLALLADLPAASPPVLGELGYRGFLVHHAGPSPLRVAAGRVEAEGRAAADLKGAEAWLLRNARAQGWSAVLEGVAPP